MNAPPVAGGITAPSGAGFMNRPRTRVTGALNEQPGYERIIGGSTLMKTGFSVSLPSMWLAKGDELPGPEFRDQLTYGSDILMLKRVQ